MASSSGPPPGLPRPKSSGKSPSSSNPSPPPSSLFASAISSIASPVPQRAASTPWASSPVAGLSPNTSGFLGASDIPYGTQPATEAMPPAEGLCQPPFVNNTLITNLGTFPAPSPSDPWHIAHSRICAHASIACAACSVTFVCCSCRALWFTPGTPPFTSTLAAPLHRSRLASPALFRNVGNGSPPPDLDCNDTPDDNAYMRALAECDTCDNSSCPRGTDEPATWTITVEQFDEGAEEHFDRTFRACGACNRACKRSFLGFKVKSRVFDNSIRGLANATTNVAPISSFGKDTTLAPASENTISAALDTPLRAVSLLQDALHTLSARPPTPASFVATVRVRHDALCSHNVSSCPTCSLGLVCCDCKRLFVPAIAHHLACTQCKHVAFSCCDSAYCCQCRKPWMPTDAVAGLTLPSAPAAISRFRGGGDTNTSSSPEPDIWTPSPCSSPDKIDDLTARANVPLPASRPDSDASRVDNKAAANAVFNFKVKSSQMSILRINYALLDWLSSHPKATLHVRFAPGHHGIEGNKCADATTKAGLGRCPMQPPLILWSHFINDYKQEQSDAWTRLFKDHTYRGSQWLPVCRKKKTFKPSHAKEARNFFHNMAHGDPSRLSRISYAITNHAPTGEYQMRFFPDQPAHCPHCGETTLQSRRHVLCECPRYVAKFSSLIDWGSQRHNDKALSGFLDKNPTAFSFRELPRDVH